ncbi:ABC transporter permease subunit, partial [Thermobrachium celere]
MPKINSVIGTIINITRSIPFIILIIVLFPLSRVIVGTTIGKEAAVVPLSIAAAPFVARVVESALKEVNKGVVEAAVSLGASIP